MNSFSIHWSIHCSCQRYVNLKRISTFCVQQSMMKYLLLKDDIIFWILYSYSLFQSERFLHLKQFQNIWETAHNSIIWHSFLFWEYFLFPIFFWFSPQFLQHSGLLLVIFRFHLFFFFSFHFFNRLWTIRFLFHFFHNQQLTLQFSNHFVFICAT